jgi:lipopolysaccharide export system protein LptA
VAVYDGSSETLLITGQPAIAEEPSGNRVQASRITWNRKTGSMDVGGDVDTPSQTLYHPEGPAKTPARRTPLPQK